ncbi:MAG: tetratricopeptide repeat protein [Planctomycetia bacterium]
MLALPISATLTFAEDKPATQTEIKEIPSPAQAAGRLLYDETANPGIDMFDRAMATRLNAERLADLGAVASYCEKAIELGLDEFNTNIAKALLATTLTQRAQFTAKAAMQPGQGRANWLALRKMALRDLEKAIRYLPKYPKALMLLAELNLLPGGDRKEASKALDRILSIEGLEPDQYQDAFILRANLEEDLPRKRAFLDKALTVNPNNFDALRLRGLTLTALGKLKEAKVDFQRALEIEPTSPETCEALATILVDLGENKEAEKVLKKLVQLAPNSIAPLTIRAQLNAQKKDYPAALDDLNHALELEPNDTGILIMRAFLYHEMKLPKRAMADVEKVLKIRPQFDRARRFRIALLAEEGDLDQTLKELQKLYEAHPDNSEITLELAILHAMKKNVAESLKYYNKVLDKNKKNVEALEGRASIYLGMGKHAEAITDFDKANQLAPNKSEILNNLAWVLATSPKDKLRNGKRAIKLATKACELTEYKKPHILSTLAAAYAETGNFKKAIQFSTKAVELSEELEDAKIQEALQKELRSYQEKKPWREFPEEGSSATDNN